MGVRIAVVGAGAVGGTIAALLARSGHEVSVTARGEHLETISRDGIRLTGAWGDHLVQVAAGATLTTTPHLALVTTKAQDADAAINANRGMLDGIPVVVVQNGLDGAAAARRLLPSSDVIGALAVFAASFLSPGQISVTTAGATYLDGTRAASAAVAELLGAAVPVTVTDNFAGALWSKLIVNQVNALPAITGLSVQQVIANRALRRVMTASMREAARVGFAAGIRFDALQGLTNPIIRGVCLAPLGLSQLLPLAMARRMGARQNPGSTQQSIRRGQLTEIDYLNGAVVRTGRDVGVPTPVNERLVDLVHTVEGSGRFLGVDEALRMLGR